MPDETIPADSSRPDERRSPFDGFRRDEFTFHSFDGQPPSPPADEPPAYYDDPDEDDPDPADVFMAVTVDGQTPKQRPPACDARSAHIARPPAPPHDIYCPADRLADGTDDRAVAAGGGARLDHFLAVDAPDLLPDTSAQS